MKNIITLILTVVALSIAHAQCPDETIVLLTQSDDDNFASQYPNCSRLNRSLYIGVSECTNLNPNCINEVDPITNLSGLNHLNYIADTLLIQCNNALVTIEDMNGLDSIGNIIIIYNEVLESINGFTNLKKVGKDFNNHDEIQIHHNDNLNSILGFKSIEQIGSITIRINSPNAIVDFRKLEEAFSLSIRGNIELLDMDSIRLVQNFYVSNNASFQDFRFVRNKSVEIYIINIRDQPNALSFDGLEHIKSSRFDIRNVPFVDFSPLDSLMKLESLSLWDCDNCTSLTGLENLNFIRGLIITDLPLLTSLDGISFNGGSLEYLYLFDCPLL